MLTRRQTLLTGAAMPFLAGAAALPRAAEAQGAPAPTPFPLHRAFRLGDVTVHALLAGTSPQENPHETFGLNVDQATFERVSAENFIPADRSQGFFTPTLVDTGSERVLFDAGLQAPGLLAALEAAGMTAADVTHVVLTHHHPDHIGGLSDDAGTLTFPDAAYVTGQAEFDFWSANPSEAWTAKVAPLAERFAFIAPGDAVAPGITAVETFGHTPGHLAFTVDAGEPLMITGDMTNHFVWSLAHPDWEVRFDMDKARAAETRRRVLGMLAAERMPMLGYHMPFPAVGFVEAREDGFRWVPVSYQFTPAA